MQKLKYVIVAGLLLLTMSACGSSESSVSEQESSVLSSPSSITESSSESSTESNDESDDYDYDTSEDESSDEYYEQTVSYIGERSVQYTEAQDMYNLMFALSDHNESYMKSSGTASITIKDNKENILYKKDIDFDESDFTEWTNSNRDDSTLGCWLNIPRTDVEGAASSMGTLTLEVTTTDNIHFEPYDMSIFDLREKTVEIKLPELPAIHVDKRYSDEISYVTIHSLTYKQTYIDTEGKASVEFEAVISLDDKTSGENISGHAEIGYKVYDEDDVVVESGDIYTNNLEIGEKSKNTFTIRELDPMKTYTLKLFDRV